MISQEKLESYQLAMFPLMLQALYNARVVLGNNQAKTGKLIDDGSGRSDTIKDINVVLDAFASIGVKRRFGKTRTPLGWSLRHFNDVESEKVILLFNPDMMERDEEIDEIKAKHMKVQNDLLSTIARRNVEIDELRKVNGELRTKVDQLNKQLRSWEVYPKTSVVLTDMLRFPMTAEEMRNEVRGLIGVGYELRDKFSNDGESEIYTTAKEGNQE